MNEWIDCSLGDVLTLQRGFDLPSGSRRAGKVPVVSSAGITGVHDEARVSAPGVVIGRYGTLGEVHYVQEDFWPLNTTLWVKDFKGNHPHFCAYMLETIGIADTSGSAAVPGVNRNVLHGLPVCLPPIETQRRIASILGAYDDLIEVNRRRIAVLEEMARGLFEEWFVRFRFPGHEAVPIINTPDGPLPEGWTWGALGDLLSLPYGKALKADARRPGDVAVIGSSGVVGSHVEALVAGPGIVVGRKGNVGSVIWSATDFWPIDTTYYVDTRLPLLYVYQLLQRVPFENSHAAVPGLNRDYALSKVVMIAPDALVQRYGAFSEPLMDQVTTLGRSNRSLAASRDLLLPRLISRQLSVAEAERELEEAA